MKTTRSQTKGWKSHQRDKHLGCLLHRILWTILKVDKGRTSTNRLEKKQIKHMTMHKVLDLEIRDHPDYSIIKIGQNIEKSPGDLRKIVVTQAPVKNHQLTLV